MNKSLKEKLYDIIFESDTKAGKTFDVALLVVILFSILVVMLESVPRYESRFGDLLRGIEWVVTIEFTLE